MKSPHLISRSVSALWGLSEAIFFFIVPDIWLSRQAMLGGKNFLWAISLCLIGALCGGTIMYYLGSTDYDSSLIFLDHVPAIYGQMIANAGQQIEQKGILKALLTGMMTGIPYKIYSVWAGHLGVPYFAFILSSLCARVLRFLVVSGLISALSYMLKDVISLKKRLWLHAIGWALFYGLYFYHFGF